MEGMNGMNQKMLVAEFREALEQLAEGHYQSRLHQAFVAWYIAAEFGERAEWDFTDDAGDGGIDAIVWRPEDNPPVVIVQSKFSANVGGAQLSRRAYAELEGVVDAFRGNEEEFSEWLARTRDDLRAKYRRARIKLRDIGHWAHEKKAFRLITTQRRRRSAEFESIPKDNFVYADDILRLYEQYRKGVTPRARELELAVEQKLSYYDRQRKVSSFLFNARVSDFRRYLEKNDVARLVARNIRYNLSGRVGREIKHTYESRPLDFWYLHNGMTIVCDEFRARGGRAILVNPSVVNGAQTLYAVSGSSHGSSPALVTVRVITRTEHERPIEDDNWLQEVIRGVNTQNRVKAYDFRSNEPEQVELQKLFREVQVFYERKRGERREYRNEPRFRGFARLPLFRLGQILQCTAEADGSGVITMKRGLEDVFSNEKAYRRLFPTKGTIGRRFEKIYLAYRLHRLLDNHGYANARLARRQRHGFWNALWLAHFVLSATPRLYSRLTLKDIRDAFDDLESPGRWRTRARAAMRRVTKATWSTWRKGRTRDPEKWTPNNFFKAPYGNKMLLKVALPSVRDALKPIRERLLAKG